MKPLKVVLFVTMLGFVLLQFFRPGIPSTAITKDFDGPQEVKSILKTSCYSCHSNETKLAWFDQINPGYLLARSHIMAGRSYLNFSHWDSLNVNQQRGKLFDALNVIKAGRMPKKEYAFLHPESKLDSAKIEILENYILSLEQIVKYNHTKWEIAKTYSSPDKEVKNVEPAPNGINYIPDYKNWQVISTTDRFDNNTIRIIFANEIVVKAINQGKNNPYPDGSIIAKVVSEKIASENGELIAGKFKHVEFMIKDSKKYASTENWGWARWLGNEKKPFGENALFANQCINCHKPVKSSDYVFTMPILFSQKNNF